MTQSDKITIVIDGENICSFDEALLPQVREIINANSPLGQMIEEMVEVKIYILKPDWYAVADEDYEIQGVGATPFAAIRALHEKWQAQQ